MNPDTTALGRVANDPPLDLTQIKIDPSWALLIPPSLAVRRQIMPLCLLDGEVWVACRNPSDLSALRVLARHIPHPLRPVAATHESLQEVFRKIFGDLESAMRQNLPATLATSGTGETEDAATLCDGILRSALMRQASDVHVNPASDGLQIRFRVDGRLEDFARHPPALYAPIVNRLKVMSRLDIAEKRAPQDGGFRFQPSGDFSPVDIRTASLPSRHGERLTLRLLSSDSSRFSLDSLGFSPDQRDIFTRALDYPHGMLLVTGPTGSGKSTSLYSGIRHLLASRDLNIITIEDPVEYEMAGVIQSEVERKGEKLSFASALRSVLRHDPDVIMLGEIRDAETASLAIKASLTGHLVLSTLHTNTAAGAVTRLVDLGIDPFLVSAVLRLTASQRLVRRLCPRCHVPRPLTREEAQLLGCPEKEGTTVYEPGGCLHCAGRGFIGRIGLFELLPVGEQLSRLIAAGGASETALERACGNYRSLIEDARRKIFAGESTVKEVLSTIVIH